MSEDHAGPAEQAALGKPATICLACDTDEHSSLSDDVFDDEIDLAGSCESDEDSDDDSGDNHAKEEADTAVDSDSSDSDSGQSPDLIFASLVAGTLFLRFQSP